MRRNCSRQSGLVGVLWQHVLPVRVSLYIAHKEVLLHPEYSVNRGARRNIRGVRLQFRLLKKNYLVLP